MKESPLKKLVNLFSPQKHIRIYQYEGTSQYIVRAGMDEASFVYAEDAQRFAKQLTNTKIDLKIHPLKKYLGF